ncbi:hypothetical protein PQI07_28220 [Methylobacterium sp. 092160098-2]|jgi:hypothetical protein|uniref:hypothetical protein n=1 Tax=Methylobacterium sp. 092160098-2 TaxID=3025129 RepID=UPI002381AA3B|nr:hypothetical protein [Methylobacterium sp. 092160098-2]MDE4914556.1 hypothetical protein [Methylobacterium sp. 092160098-2]
MPSATAKNFLGRILVSVGILAVASPAMAAGRSIVGEWAPDPANCLPFAGAMKISAMSMVADEMSCSFRSVVRDGDKVTWRGGCSSGSKDVPSVVVATLHGETLAVRINNQPADTYRRCRR